MGEVQKMLAVSREAEAQKIKEAAAEQAKADAAKESAAFEAFKKFEDEGGGRERGLNPDEKAEAAEQEQPEPTEEAPETGEPDSGEVTEEPETDSNDEGEDPEVESRRKAAMSLLGRSKAPKSVLEAMDIDELEAWAADVKPILKAQDEAFRQLREQKPGKEASTKDSKESEDVIATSDVPDGAALKAARKALVEEFGEEGANAVEALVAPLQSENRALREAITSIQDRDLNKEVSGQRARLEGAGYEFTDEAWDAVEAKAAALTRTGEYQGNLTRLFEHAALLQQGPPDKKAKPDTKQRERGSPTRGKSSSKDAPKTPRQKQRAMLQALERGDPNWMHVS